jgi:hypothetical protein
MMDKKAALAQVPALLKEAASHMKAQSTKLAELTESYETVTHELKAMKLAQRMVERGLDPESTWADKVASLKGMSSEKLATMEQAIELAQAPLSLPKVATADTHVTPTTANFDDFILSQSALS